MEKINYLLVLVVSAGLLSGCLGTPGLKTPLNGCAAEKGINIFAQRLMIPDVASENGNCAVLKDTAPKMRNRVTYALLKGKIAEIQCAGYTIRIADQDLDGRVDNYDLIDRAGNIVLGVFKDLDTGKVYSKCTLPGRALNGADAKPEDDDALDVHNDLLTNPEKFRRKLVNP